MQTTGRYNTHACHYATAWLIGRMKQARRETDSHSAGQNIPHLLFNPVVLIALILSYIYAQFSQVVFSVYIFLQTLYMY
jgi:hypothetical protein